MDLSATSPGDHPAPLIARSPEPLGVAVLTRRLVEGDEAAYRMFYHAYVDRLTRYLIVVTAGDEHATRDALQGTLTRVVQHIRVFTDEATFWSWLTVLARSARADDRRKRRRYLAFLDRFTRHTVTENIVPPTASHDDRLNQSLTLHVARLPADERELIEWKYTQQRSVREIAAHLATTEKAVESRLGRIRVKLKEVVLAELKHERAT